MTDVNSCKMSPTGAHVLGADRRYVANGGPMDGTWLVAECCYCNTFSIGPESGGDGLDLLIAKLDELGCDPRPAA